MDIGGECVWVLGEYIDKAKAGFSGMVHVYPFTCMPEVTARTIITNHLKKKYGLPFISFSFDESNAVEGFRTRLEAFIDLMESKKNQEKHNTEFQRKHTVTYGSVFYNECLKMVQNK